jgi:hypothetical protein
VFMRMGLFIIIGSPLAAGDMHQRPMTLPRH